MPKRTLERPTSSHPNRGNLSSSLHSKGLEQAIRLDPRSSHTSFERGLARYGQKNFELAIQDFDKALDKATERVATCDAREARFTVRLANTTYQSKAILRQFHLIPSSLKPTATGQ